MSLKFGIYLVEQRIITPEQFCGLVKVQQEATQSIANIAIRKNVLTIKQVADVFDIQENSPEKPFLQIAVENDLMVDADANMLMRVQELSSPSIRKLTVECGLLTERQSAVLFHHFEKMSAKAQQAGGTMGSETMHKSNQTQAMPTQGVPTPKQMPTQNAETMTRQHPPAPKYQQKPMIVSPYQSS